MIHYYSVMKLEVGGGNRKWKQEVDAGVGEIREKEVEVESGNGNGTSN